MHALSDHLEVHHAAVHDKLHTHGEWPLVQWAMALLRDEKYAGEEWKDPAKRYDIQVRAPLEVRRPVQESEPVQKRARGHGGSADSAQIVVNADCSALAAVLQQSLLQPQQASRSEPTDSRHMSQVLQQNRILCQIVQQNQVLSLQQRGHRDARALAAMDRGATDMRPQESTHFSGEARLKGQESEEATTMGQPPPRPGRMSSPDLHFTPHSPFFHALASTEDSQTAVAVLADAAESARKELQAKNSCQDPVTEFEEECISRIVGNDRAAINLLNGYSGSSRNLKMCRRINNILQIGKDF
mmetsp:Transcript_8962/g.14157  ORF Transcript_8962/g.14157 Transcript_8962/m.14157 type:complete len:300 (-) Transcript_8962:216-1115(-)